jgi:glucosamine--fructose-6-phosphate aminotransferase (isomerizing)
MCGIFGYVGEKQAWPILLNGLKNLEYRGYDSAGMYISSSGVYKSVGQVKNLEKVLLDIQKEKSKSISGKSGIAHTRWATHGEVLTENTHPHSGENGRIWLVHNGVIENYKELKNYLAPAKFRSETDTEVLAYLIEDLFKKNGFNNLKKAILKALGMITGSYALAIIDKENPETIYVARKGSPLVIGVKDKEIFISSDLNSLSEHTDEVFFLEDGEIGILEKDYQKFFSITDLEEKEIIKKVFKHTHLVAQASKENHEHFMLKEILEQPDSIKRALNTSLNLNEFNISKFKNIYLIACGTSYHAALFSKYFLEQHVKVPVLVENASEFRYSNNFFSKKILCIFLSQSGETADTLEALRLAKSQNLYTLAIVNVPGSTLAREADTCILTNAGPEIAVASTKAFTSQIAVLSRLAQAKLTDLSGAVSGILSQNNIKKISDISIKYAQYKNFLFLGRGPAYAIALESALKLKEISYIHAEGYLSSEMKHGLLALVDEDFPIVSLVLKDSLYEKNLSTIQEIKARRGKVIAIASEGDTEIASLVDDVIYIPGSLSSKTDNHEALIASAVALQLFAYFVAKALGREIDKPRNLAKSVTVE